MQNLRKPIHFSPTALARPPLGVADTATRPEYSAFDAHHHSAILARSPRANTMRHDIDHADEPPPFRNHYFVNILRRDHPSSILRGMLGPPDIISSIRPIPSPRGTTRERLTPHPAVQPAHGGRPAAPPC